MKPLPSDSAAAASGETSRVASIGETMTAAGAGPPLARGEPLPRAINRFVVRGLIGEGAFGQVLRARDPELERDVAIKIPRAGTLSRPDDVQRFLREGKAAATVQHPNICPIYEVGTADGRPYIVMALVPGKSLAEHLKQLREPMAERQAALIVRKLAQALAAAHSKGIVHRDLKPANILIDRDRKDVVVMDFGLARREAIDAAQLTHSGVLMGTPAYMSPEQARGDSRAIGPASDIYSLGVMLYELLAGQRPFSGSLAEVLGKILHVPPPALSAVRVGVDPRLAAICLKAMAKEPAERYASMQDLAADLTAYLKDPLRADKAIENRSAASGPPSESQSQTSEARRLDEMFAALSADLKAGQSERQAEVAAAVKAAARAARIPLWQWLAGAALLAAMLLAGIWYFGRTPTASVLINIDVDLADPELVFRLDNEPIAAAALAAPLELAVGRHELLVLRGDKLERKFLFDVKGGAAPAVKIRDVSPPAAPVKEERYALRFNGQTDGVILPIPLLPATCTIEAWARAEPRDATRFQTIVDADFASGRRTLWEKIHPPTPFMTGAFGGAAERNWIAAHDTQTPLEGKLVHLAGVWAAGQPRLFIDGQRRDGVQSDAVQERVPAQRWLLGCRAVNSREEGDSFASSFLGTIYAVRISDFARYEADFTPTRDWQTDEHTLALYRFTEGTGQVLHDASGHKYDGKIIGAQWAADDSPALPPGEQNYAGYSRGRWRPVFRTEAEIAAAALTGKLGENIKLTGEGLELGPGASLISPVRLRNFAVRGRFLHVPGNSCSIMMRGAGLPNPSHYGCYNNGRGTFGIYGVGLAGPTLTAPAVTVPLRKNEYFEWMVVADGDAMMSFVNGKQLFRCTDRRLPAGTFSLNASNADNRAIVRDLQYRDLDAPDTQP